MSLRSSLLKIGESAADVVGASAASIPQRSKINDLLDHQFCEYDVMYAIQAVLIYLYFIQRQRTIFNPQKKLTVEATAIVHQSGFKWLGDNFLIKKDEHPNSNIENEAILGLWMNALRKLIPNFMYTFALLPDNRLVLEYVRGISLNQVLVKALVDETELRKIYLQIFCALCVAKKHFQFIHNDLHTGNIIIRTLRFPITIKYDLGLHPGDTNIYITTKYIATIIDYGFSSFLPNKKSERMGTGNNKIYNVEPHNNNNFIDIFKLISSSSYTSGVKNYPSVMKDLHNIFTTVKLTPATRSRLMSKNKNYHFYYPDMQDFNSVRITPVQVMNYLLDVPSFRAVIDMEPPRGTVMCPDGMAGDRERMKIYIKDIMTTDTPTAPSQCQDFNFKANIKSRPLDGEGNPINPGDCLQQTDTSIIIPKGYSLYVGVPTAQIDYNAPPQTLFSNYNRAKSKYSKYNVQAYITTHEFSLEKERFNEKTGAVNFSDGKAPSANVVRRDYQNPLDWQYMPMNRLFGQIKKLVESMPPEKYNHAIWSALYMADFIADYNFPEQMNRLLIVAIFLHEFMDLQTVLAGGDLKILLEDFGLDYECRFMMLMFIQSANFIAESTFKHDFFIKTRKLFESYSLSFKKGEAPQRAILLTAIVLFNKAHLLGVEVYKSKDYTQRRLRAIDFNIPNTDINSRLPYYTYLSNQASTKAPKVVIAYNALINNILKEIDLL